jgi:hypothetical protein
MSSLSITSLMSFFSGEQKSVNRGENHFKSDHVECFLYNQGVLRGEVHASMKKKVYKVTVSYESGGHIFFANSLESIYRYCAQFVV